MKQNKFLIGLQKFLLGAGAINWGAVGIGRLANANWNLVEGISNMLLDNIAWGGLETTVYVGVGVAGLAMIDQAFNKGKIVKNIGL